MSCIKTATIQFYKRINGADTEMHDLCLLNDDLVFKCKHGYAVGNKVTVWARLELYNKLLDLMGENVLYVDTDSCVYVSKPEGPKPAISDFLGDLTNEITPKHGPESYITYFVCGGPKNYAYKVSDGKTHCKNSLVLNPDTLKEIICKYESKPVGNDKKREKKPRNVKN